MSHAPTRVLVVEDDRRLHTLLARVLAGYETILVTHAREALDALPRHPDVAIVDLGLPDMDGIELIQRLVAARPSLLVLVVTVTSEPARILAALRAGARGYLFKEDLAQRVGDAIDEVLLGGVPLSRDVARLLLSQVGPTPPSQPGSAELTPREHEVLVRLAKSLTYEQVASDLGISVNTVRAHIRSLYAKLEVATRTEAVLAAIQRRWIEPD